MYWWKCSYNTCYQSVNMWECVLYVRSRGHTRVLCYWNGSQVIGIVLTAVTKMLPMCLHRLNTFYFLMTRISKYWTWRYFCSSKSATWYVCESMLLCVFENYSSKMTVTYPGQIARFMGPTWGPTGSCRTLMGPMLAPWTLISGTERCVGIPLCFLLWNQL